MTETHVELPGSRRPSKSDARRLRDVDPHAHIEVTITLKAPALPDVTAASEPALTPEEFAQRYGAASGDVHTVEAVLRGYGLTTEELAPDRRSLRMSGTAAAMESAFHPGLGIYHNAEQGEFRGREGTLKVPAELAGIVTGVFGLDQRRVAHRRSAQPAESMGRPLTPAQLEVLYNFPSGDCAGQSVAIAEFGAPLQSGSFLAPAYLADDVRAFCAAQGRALPNIEIVSVDLSPLTAAQLHSLPANVGNVVLDETGEVMMDVEIVAALCANATVYVYFASFDQKGWVDLLTQVASGQPATPVCLSISYGLAEDSPDWSAAALQAINNGLQAAALQGITVCVSAGDDGSGANMSGAQAHVEFPASSPNVLAIGGTMLTGSAASEVVWWESPGRRTTKGGGATGGGVSTLFARPGWQSVSVPSLNRGGIDGRVVPDVAALAGPPLYNLILDGQPSPNGGTSASAPLWASLIARINAALPADKRQRFIAPLLYAQDADGKPQGQSACRDITSGQNASHPKPGKGYSAGPGYDAVTGWGVPDGKALLAALTRA
ncbi:S53 family peptidase [Paraburkholderia sp. BL10I2N1]|uniref:S53 family peptidase n=1 Tax=Paraburkholderia sp. BL10I2N1 TaxID=1938796 RepID=UPI00105E9607|nr:S53 family peptidase [Paraburkholderia sp. BL10I2N1]TDN61258.1 kumamolisin [Paraburkholderia sp. BL10I2N1]